MPSRFNKKKRKKFKKNNRKLQKKISRKACQNLKIIRVRRKDLEKKINEDKWNFLMNTLLIKFHKLLEKK